MWQRFFMGTLVVCLVSMASPGQVFADFLHGYALGVSVDNVVTPGSIVSISATLKNTGTAAIVFPVSITSGPPSVQGGSLPFGGASSGGDWNIFANNFNMGPTYGVNNFFDQFEGQTINPGDDFAFVLGTFLAPTTEPSGSIAILNVNIGIDYTDTIVGNLSGGSGAGYDYSSFNNTPTLFFELGSVPSQGAVGYYYGLVIDVETGDIISSPPAEVPEPSAYVLMGSLLMAFGFRRIIR